MSGNGKGGKSNDGFIAKIAGAVIFTGIAVSVFKAFRPKKPLQLQDLPLAQDSNDTLESAVDEPQNEVKEKVKDVAKEVNIFGSDIGKRFQKGNNKKRSSQAVEIFKGDTLWSLSRKYGVSVDQIKAANGYSDDTIYAGEKLTIP